MSPLSPLSTRPAVAHASTLKRSFIMSLLCLPLSLSAPLSAPSSAHAKDKDQGSKESGGAKAPSAAQAVSAPRQDSGDTPYGFKVGLGGYAQVRYQRIQDDPTVGQFIGLNDGFTMSNARLNLELTNKKKGLSAFFSLEGARERREANNRAQGDVRTLILDAYIDLELPKQFTLRFGQFKPAYDANELESTASLLFVDRALESRGVLGVEGINEAGLSLSRQVGAQLLGRLVFTKDLTLKLIASLTNGNSSEEALNDNDSLAYTGRVELKQRFGRAQSLTVGGGAHMNTRSTGELPDLIAEERLGFTADARLKLKDFVLQGQWMRLTRTAVDVPQEPIQEAEGYHVEVGIDLGALSPSLRGVSPVYRFATYDPTARVDSTDATLSQALSADKLTHHTVGVNALLTKHKARLPLKLQLNYTFAQEQDARASDNDRLDVLLQMMF